MMATEEAAPDKAASIPADGGQDVAAPEADSQEDSVTAAVNEAQAKLVEASTSETESSPSQELPDTSSPASTPVVGAGADSTSVPASSPAAGSGFLGALTSAGIEHSFQSEEEAAKSYAELRGKLSERDELAKIGQQVLPHWDKVQGVMQAATAPTPEESAWSPPGEFNPAWMAELQKPEDERDPITMQKLSERLNYVGDKWQGWMHNPNSFIDQMVMPAIEKRLDAERRAGEARTSINSAITENEDVCKKYQAEISGLIGKGTPAEVAIQLYVQQDQIAALQAGTTPAATKVPVAGQPAVANAPASGVVQQVPQGEPAATEADAERWQDPRKCALEAAASLGIDTQTGPAAI